MAIAMKPLMLLVQQADYRLAKDKKKAPRVEALVNPAKAEREKQICD